MSASPVLVDSSFYMGCLREGRDPLRLLAVAAAARDLAVCGVVRCEVGRGLKQAKVRSRFEAFWNVMLNVPTDNRLWAQAEATLWELDRQGTVLPLTDVVVACCARRIGAVVLTRDRHFDQVPGLVTIDQPPV